MSDDERCKARTVGHKRCKRRAQWEGLCFQHWRIVELRRRGL